MIIGNLNVDEEISQAKQRLHDQIDGIVRFKKHGATITIKLDRPVHGLYKPDIDINRWFDADGYMFFSFNAWIKIRR